eukprot:TRINITY_DN7666_c0_g2_i1.p1 TRINITY_DN7666_c0_g2~~TRINITY_DN7666_c0_g2_i1.p1  ORF type:complete len:222 (+),score=28.14 TRINITY_DN7666_c0_g2_i1:123-788(+)
MCIRDSLECGGNTLVRGGSPRPQPPFQTACMSKQPQFSGLSAGVSHTVNLKIAPEPAVSITALVASLYVDGTVVASRLLPSWYTLPAIRQVDVWGVPQDPAYFQCPVPLMSPEAHQYGSISDIVLGPNISIPVPHSTGTVATHQVYTPCAAVQRFPQCVSHDVCPQGRRMPLDSRTPRVLPSPAVCAMGCRDRQECSQWEYELDTNQCLSLIHISEPTRPY